MRRLESLFARPRTLCPVCGKPAYSREGLHPQCAFKRACREQQERLRAGQRASTQDAGSA